MERTRLEPGVIELTVRNDGPDAVQIAQVVVNDAFAAFTGGEDPVGRLAAATLRIRQPWVEGEAYEVILVTSTGGTIVHEIPVAVATPVPDVSFFGLHGAPRRSTSASSRSPSGCCGCRGSGASRRPCCASSWP